MPYPKHNAKSDFTEENKLGEECWSKKAMSWGNKLVSCLIDIDKALSSNTGKTPPPIWIAEKKICFKKMKSL